MPCKFKFLSGTIVKHLIDFKGSKKSYLFAITIFEISKKTVTWWLMQEQEYLLLIYYKSNDKFLINNNAYSTRGGEI